MEVSSTLVRERLAMSIEHTTLGYARPHIIEARAQHLLAQEISKGCHTEISARPVQLEPPYAPISFRGSPDDSGEVCWVVRPEKDIRPLIRLQIWIDREQKCDWNRSERLLKFLASLRNPVGMEIAGNCDGIVLQYLCAAEDARVLTTAFRGEFDLCELVCDPQHSLLQRIEDPRSIAFADFLPQPPYSHLLTQPDELRSSPYAVVMTAISGMPSTAVGIYQVLFQAVHPDHNWHRNVEQLLDLEYAAKLAGGMPTPQRYAQQVPSGDLREMSDDVTTKAHNDKPFFAVALRAGVISDDDAETHLRPLAMFQHMIQSGGRPLSYLTHHEYAQSPARSSIDRLFAEGLVFRSGFLANSRELTSLAHIPPATLLDREQLPAAPLENLVPRTPMAVGTPIGRCKRASQYQPVCVPDIVRTKHQHIIGTTGSGKSSLLEHQILHDINAGSGVAVLDPHGALIDRLLCLVPERHAHRIIYANPGDPEHVLLWNPLRRPVVPGRPAMDAGRVAADIVAAFQSFMPGWGDRLDHLLRHSVAAVMQLPDGTLRDVADLLRRKSSASEAIRQRLIETLDGDYERQFWIEDFPRYAQADVNPTQHKLSKLLASTPVQRMLSQPRSAIDLAHIMDRAEVLLVDLSWVGTTTREVLGCFMLSLFYQTAMCRGQNHDERVPFHIYCDEAHRFLTDALEDMIAETRKFGVSLTMAHQYLRQFGTRRVDALSNVGTTVIFAVDGSDAQYLEKDLFGRAKAEDLVGQPVGHAIVRIGNEIIRVQAPAPLELLAENSAHRIIAQSHRRYYVPAVPQHRHDVEQPPPIERTDRFHYDTFD